VGNNLTKLTFLSIVLLVVSGAGQVYAQVGLVDSLLQAASEPMTTGEKVRTYNLIAAGLRRTDRYRAAEMAEKAMALAIGSDDRRGQADALTIKGQLSEDSDSFAEALNLYHQALS